MRKKIIFGNWKMNGTNAAVESFLTAVDNQLNGTEVIAGLGLPFTALATGIKNSKNIKIAAENVHFAPNGAFTGEVSIPMLQEIGVEYVIIGHSERREMFNETNETVNEKAIALLKEKMIPIICVGETLKIREANQTIEFVNEQVRLAYQDINAVDAIKTILAYEPIWAIGTGKTATPQDAQIVCQAIRQNLATIYDQMTADQIVIQYGGSVKPDNIAELMSQPDIDGALVGGASLIAKDYLGLINYKK